MSGGSEVDRVNHTPAALERARVRGALRANLFGAEAIPVRVDRFEIRRRLGSGAMGIVYAAYDPTLQREVALKMLSGVAAKKRESFLHEARSLAKLSHPHILPVYEAGVVDGVPYIVSELVDGGTLRTWLEAEKRTVEQKISLLMAVGRALLLAHQRGITHRDIKPENVLVGFDGRPRIADFGLALSADPSQGGVEATAMAGTPRYMAPEQLRGEGVDPSSDQFSYCAMVFESLFGRMPFEAATPHELLYCIENQEPSIDPGHEAIGYAQVLRRGLRASPSSRYPSMVELLEALDKVSNSASTPARSKHLIAPAKLPWVLGSSALALFGIVAVVAFKGTGGASRRGNVTPPPLTTHYGAQGSSTIPTQSPQAAPSSRNKADEGDAWASPLHGPRICISACIESVHIAQELYASWVDLERGPTGSERTVRGVQSVYSACESCSKHARINPVPASLEASTTELLQAIERLLPIAQDAETYYERASYKEDHMARGKTLHRPLSDAYASVSRAAVPFRRIALDEEAKEQSSQPLYAPARMLLVQGRKEVSELDHKALRQALIAFEQALESSQPADLMSFNAAKELATSGHALLRRGSQPGSFSARERRELGSGSGWTIDGSPDLLIKSYSSLASNQHWIEPCRHYLSQKE